MSLNTVSKYEFGTPSKLVHTVKTGVFQEVITNHKSAAMLLNSTVKNKADQGFLKR